MSLVTRVSMFFLAALAVILVGNSLLFYFLLAQQLQEQFDQQLHSALHTLVAAVEVEPDDVKFEPSDHTIALGVEDGAEDVRWAVFDEAGLPVQHSKNLLAGRGADDRFFSFAKADREGDASHDAGDWRILQQRLAAPMPKPVAERDPLERSALVVTVGRSPADLHANLRMIAILAMALPAALWIAAALAGRWFCEYALRPVTEMATEARTITGEQPERRLPVSPSGDELTQLAVAFNALLDELFQALARQRRFTGDAAHQLRTPLTAMLGQAEVALRRPRSEEEYRRTLTIVRDEAAELRGTLEALLFLARAAGDAQPPDSGPIDLGPWLDEQARRWHDHPRAADLQWQADPGARISASPELLDQLLSNLVGNALKYSEPGTPVEIAARRENGRVTLSVADRGIGIPEAETQAVFDPFYRGEAARRSGIAGVGLGLSIAARIAQVLGGELTCTSRSGQGSRFALALPAERSL